MSTSVLCIEICWNYNEMNIKYSQTRCRITWMVDNFYSLINCQQYRFNYR